MELGKKIYESRKKLNLSQEQLAEKVGVARQTISKWELGETAPDIRQAQILSQIFNVSLDELTGNDTGGILYEKVSNTERLAGIVINILKIFGIFILLSVIVSVMGVIAFANVKHNVSVDKGPEKVFLGGELGEEEYVIEIGDDGTFETKGLDEKIKEDIGILIDFDNLENTVDKIESYMDKLREEKEQESP